MAEEPTGKERNPAEAMLEAIRQAARDMTRTPATLRTIEMAFTLLKELSGEKFEVKKKLDRNGDTVFETNIPAERHQPFPRMRLTVSTTGEVFITATEQTALNVGAQHDVAASNAPPALIKELMSRRDSIDFFAEHLTTATPAQRRTEADAALADIARMAVFNQQVTATPDEKVIANGTAATAALASIHQALDEMALTEILGGEIIDGLSYLGTLSNGGLRVTYAHDAGSSDIVLDCAPGKQLETMSFRVMADGKVTFLWNPQQTLMLMSYSIASGGSPDIGGKFAEYNALDENDITRILCSAARSAVFAGAFAPLPRGLVPASAAQKMVLETVREAAQQVTQARTAADEIIHGLEFLKGQLTDFRYKEEKKPESSDVIIVINPHKPAPLRITVNALGKINLSDDTTREYDAIKRADMDKILTSVTRRAFFQQPSVAPARSSGKPSF